MSDATARGFTQTEGGDNHTNSQYVTHVTKREEALRAQYNWVACNTLRIHVDCTDHQMAAPTGTDLFLKAPDTDVS